MSWTDERVELLKKLWMEGLSASQIAGELGQGVTRNAVIGKVHRLKLSGRAKPAASTARPRAASRPARRMSPSSSQVSSSGGGMRRRSMGSAPATMGAVALKQSEDMDADLHFSPQTEELFIPVEERLGLLALNEQTCKWPIGDPMNPDFHFCGRESLEAKPYCDFHSRKAYQKIERKRR
jgi:GcrA cell cycle regulator